MIIMKMKLFIIYLFFNFVTLSLIFMMILMLKIHESGNDFIISLKGVQSTNLTKCTTLKIQKKEIKPAKQNMYGGNIVSSKFSFC